jgi:hypothetical protein
VGVVLTSPVFLIGGGRISDLPEDVADRRAGFGAAAEIGQCRRAAAHFDQPNDGLQHVEGVGVHL